MKGKRLVPHSLLPIHRICLGVVPAILALCSSSLAAAAEDPAPTTTVTAAPDTAHCTLHVWPGSNLRSTYSGWFHGGIVDGAVTGRQGYQKLPANPLDTAAQRDALAGIDIAQAIGLPGYDLVLHDVTLDSRTMRTAPGPWQNDAGSCYAELAVDDAFYQEDVFSGRYLKVIFRFRKFDGTVPTRSFGQITAERLLILPPTSAEADPQPWLNELRDAFARSVRDFGAALQAPPRRRK